MYTSPAILLQMFGARELAQVADDTGLVDAALMELTIDAGDRSAYSNSQIQAADEALVVIVYACDRADSEVDSYIASAVTLPLAQIPPILQALAADLARFAIYDTSPPEIVKTRAEYARRHLRDISLGRATIPGADALSIGDVETSATYEDRIFTMETLQDY